MDKDPLLRRPGDLEAPEIEAALAACEGDWARAAERLEVSTRGLRDRARKLDLV